MRIRIPASEKIKNLNFDPENIQTLGDYHAEYQVKVITPIYGGGVKAGHIDKDMPIRASAIRGQLRFWWRFLHSNGDNRLEGKQLFEKERSIWGGMGDEKTLQKEKDYSSKIIVKIHTEILSNNSIIGAKQFLKNHEGNNNGLTYALFPAIQGDNDDSIIKPGQIFNLRLSAHKIDKDDWEIITNTIRWWASFGGIGARSRRGLGALEVSEVINKIPSFIAPVTKTEAIKHKCDLRKLNTQEPIKAWNKAVGKLHHFRQVEFKFNKDPNKDHAVTGIGRKTKKEVGNRDQINKTYPSRSNWPEPDSIREIVGDYTRGHDPRHEARQSFPRAIFGLPIIFDFVQDSPPEKTELIPLFLIDDKKHEGERMASPLILKPMAVGENLCMPIALALPTTDLKLSLRLKNSKNSNNDHLPKDFIDTENRYWNSEKTNDVSPIKNNQGTDALTAFLNYFGGS